MIGSPDSDSLFDLDLIFASYDLAICSPHGGPACLNRQQVEAASKRDVIA